MKHFTVYSYINITVNLYGMLKTYYGYNYLLGMITPPQLYNKM